MITADTLSLNNSEIIAEPTNVREGGNIALRITDTLELNDASKISASTQEGLAGQLTLNLNQAPTNTVQLDNSVLETRASTSGDAGSLILNARDILLENGSGILASTISGEGGNIDLTQVNNLTVTSSEIAATTVTGKAGQVSVSASDNILLSGDLTNDQSDGILVSAQGGEAGSLLITAEALTVRDGAEVSVRNRGDRDAGNLAITANTVVLNRDGIIDARTDAGGGGNISLDIDSKLALRNNSEISASTIDGIGGSITLNVNADPTPIVQLNGGRVATEATGTGNAGRLAFNVESLSLNNASTLTAATNSGKGGDIAFRGLQQLNIRGNSQISASTEDGDAGRITLNRNQPAADVLRLSNSQIATQADGTGGAGRINLNTQALFMDSASRISASTQSGLGGDIVIRGITTAQLDNSEISALTLRGTAGSLSLRASDTVDLNDSSLSVEATRKEAVQGI